MFFLVELLAILSIAAASGMRIALPLLLIGLLQGEPLWSNVPLLRHIPPPVALGILVSWSLFEIFAFRDRIGRRIIQTTQVGFAPVVGAIAALAIAATMDVDSWLVFLFALIGGLVALVIHLVQLGLFYRMPKLPFWTILLQDFLCISLVLFAFDAPQQGGIIALLLLWLAIRSSQTWRRWYLAQAQRDQANPRRQKRDPD